MQCSNPWKIKADVYLPGSRGLKHGITKTHRVRFRRRPPKVLLWILLAPRCVLALTATLQSLIRLFPAVAKGSPALGQAGFIDSGDMKIQTGFSTIAFFYEHCMCVIKNCFLWWLWERPVVVLSFCRHFKSCFLRLLFFLVVWLLVGTLELHGSASRGEKF